MKRKEFDPLAYIENAFLDAKKEPLPKGLDKQEFDVEVPAIGEYLNGEPTGGSAPQTVANRTRTAKPKKFRKTEMKAPRPRRAKAAKPTTNAIDPTLQAVWESLPKNIEFLTGFFDDSVTANYYRGEFKETREELIRRLLDPELSLEETSRLLGVCPATVRRYTNRGWLNHHRTQGGQRRFRLSDIVRFVEIHGRFPQG